MQTIHRRIVAVVGHARPPPRANPSIRRPIPGGKRRRPTPPPPRRRRDGGEGDSYPAPPTVRRRGWDTNRRGHGPGLGFGTPRDGSPSRVGLRRCVPAAKLAFMPSLVLVPARRSRSRSSPLAILFGSNGAASRARGGDGSRPTACPFVSIAAVDLASNARARAASAAAATAADPGSTASLSRRPRSTFTSRVPPPPGPRSAPL